MKVAVSKIDGERYMLEDSHSMEEFHAKEDATLKKVADATNEYERWFAAAKAADPKDDRDAAILADAMRHLEAARTLKSPVEDGSSAYDSRWSPWAQSYYEEASKFKTCRDVLHFAQERIPFDHRTRVNDHKEEFAIYEKLLVEEFPFRVDTQMKLYDNPKSIPETIYRTHGRLASNVFYWHMRIMFRCQEDISPLESIMEIGGGYGSLARLWMLDDTVKIKRYAIVDLPESLFYSEVCLRAALGDDIGYWEGRDPGTRIVLIPVGRLAEYKEKSDLVINVGSLQEMSDSWVSFYMDWIDRYKPKWFYSLNYMGQSILNLHESRNFWAPRLSMAWATRLLNADIPLVKMMCSGRDFVEAIYERVEPKQKFSDWSVLKGAFFNRATYLEGLELFRQDPTVGNGLAFLAYVTHANDKKKFMCPKEALFIANLLYAKTGDQRMKKLYETLSSARKTGTL